MSGIRSTHKLYDKFAPKWARTRDAIEGGDAVRAGGETYLPSLEGQDTDEYRAYQMRPPFYDATARTAEALAGLVFARPVAINAPENVAELLDDIDYGGQTAEDFARGLVDELLAVGRGLIVVNHDGDLANPGTLADPSGRPFLSFYAAETVLDWRTQQRGGKTELVYVKVREYEQVAGVDEFSIDEVEQFRIFDIDPAGNYRQRVFREVERTVRGKSTTTTELIATSYPLIQGQPWRFMPLVLVNLTGKADPGPVPLLPIADTNLSHWRTQADLEHGAHFTGLPTPWVSGVKLAPGERVRLGSSEVLVFGAADAKAGFLQPDASAFSVLEKLSDRKEQHMAALGARMLAPEKAQAESGLALSIRSNGESGALARVSVAASSALTKAVQYMSMWMGIDEAASEEISLKLNTQFVDERLAGADISALLQAWQSGAMSLDTLIYNFQRGGRLPDGKSIDDEKDDIEASPPPLGTLGNPDPNAADPNADPSREDPPAEPPNKKPAAKSKRKAKPKAA